MSPLRIAAEIERSILRYHGNDGFEAVARIRGDDGSWQYLGRYQSHEGAAKAFCIKHQELHGIDSPYFDAHHKSHPAIVAYCAERLMERLRERSMGDMGGIGAHRGQDGA